MFEKNHTHVTDVSVRSLMVELKQRGVEQNDLNQENPDFTRPSVFISYAHKDGMDFTRRLAFALGMYMDVFWDRRLQAGEFPAQLLDEIEARELFLFIMTPHSIASEWCKKELEHAQSLGKPIALAWVYPGEGTIDDELASIYTYGDFTIDFEVGFRHLTSLMLGTPVSSWEYLSYASVEVLLDALKRGFVPCLIAKSIAEWVIINKLWGVIEEYFQRRKGWMIFRATPKTPLGILAQCSGLMEQFSRAYDGIGVYLVKQNKPIVETFVNKLMLLNENNHKDAGKIAYDLIDQIKQVSMSDAGARLDAEKLALIQNYSDFEIAEQLREFIQSYARRLRYLY